jgi:hypothetical protein
MDTNVETKTITCTTCACGNCTAAPGIDPNESCCFCNGSWEKEQAEKEDVEVEYIGAINRSNNYRYLAVVGGGMAMGVFLEKVPFEGISTADQAHETVRKLVEEEGWERLTQEQVLAYKMF